MDSRAPRPADGRAESVSQPRGSQKSGPRDSSSREAATQESPARQCRVAKVEQSRVPEGRHSSCDTVSSPPGGTGDTPVTTLTSAAIGQSARSDKEEIALPAIALRQSLPCPASRPAARDIASGRRAARAVSGQDENIPWIR